MPSFNVPAVSVIIPVRNSGRYFRECLDSVTRQTLQDIEIIIINDASTDGSDAVAEAYAAQDSRITIIHHDESTGAGPARNDGMAIARGEYIAFMDSDDLYPNADVLEKLYHKAVEQHAIICGGSLYYIDSNGKFLKKQHLEQIFFLEGWMEYFDYQYEGGFYRFIYRREFLNSSKINFPNLLRFQDSVFFVQSMIAAKKFYCVPIISYNYRKGHKRPYLDNENFISHIQGVTIVLNIANEHKLHFIYTNMIFNLKNRLAVCDSIQKIKSVIECLKKIDFSLIDRKVKKNKLKIFFILKIAELVVKINFKRLLTS